MFFINRKSKLNRILEKYVFLFENYSKRSFNDGSIDEVVFENDNKSIVFQEDLREHIVNFFVTESQKRIAKIYFREVFLADDLVGVENFKRFISELENKNNVEEKEVENYIIFLKNNKIIQ